MGNTPPSNPSLVPEGLVRVGVDDAHEVIVGELLLLGVEELVYENVNVLVREGEDVVEGLAELLTGDGVVLVSV